MGCAKMRGKDERLHVSRWLIAESHWEKGGETVGLWGQSKEM
jgi:hypothetical protein